jgi:zinc resistance-associated protein
MWKALLAGTTALAIAGASVALAQQPSPHAPQAPQAGAEDRQHWRPSEQDVNAFTDARIAAIKAGLKLTPDQEKNWPGVEQAIRDLAKDRYERRTERRNEPRPADPIERLRSRADTMTKTAADLKRLADAAGPLYQSLNEDQKHRLFFLVRSMRGHHMAMHWREHRGFDRD